MADKTIVSGSVWGAVNGVGTVLQEGNTSDSPAFQDVEFDSEVLDGEYNKLFLVNFEVTDDEFVSDKTADEIAAAVEAGKTPLALIDEEIYAVYGGGTTPVFYEPVVENDTGAVNVYDFTDMSVTQLDPPEST